jgi:hypothetical protein
MLALDATAAARPEAPPPTLRRLTVGLMDKMKAQATQIAQKTQDTARDSKVKFDQAQAKRRVDAMLRNLGTLVYAERTGRSTGDSQGQIDKLIADISAHEAENGISLAPESADHSAGTQSWGPSASAASTGFPPADPAASTGFPPDASTTQV